MGEFIEIPPRLRWLCRRGMRELDLLLEHYLQTRYSTASAAERRTFEALLGHDDPDLWSWVVGTTTLPETDVGELIKMLRSYR